MPTFLDDVLDRVTMYRLTVYVLLGLVGTATALAAANALPFSPFALLGSTAALVAICWLANKAFSWIFGVPANVESTLITALILALIIDPIRSLDDLPLLGWAAVFAMASKYLIAWKNKHIFNPAAIAVFITAVGLRTPASWWLATAPMVPMTIIGGVLIVRKLRDEEMAVWYLVAALVSVCGFSALDHSSFRPAIIQLLMQAPLFFVGGIMLTEPLTAPTTKGWKRLYGVLLGALMVPQFHIGAFYLTPELGIVIANLAAFVVTPQARLTLILRQKSRLAQDMMDFAFAPTAKFAFKPGQYLECTLDHLQVDSRGNRRYFTISSSPTEPLIHLGVRFSPRGSSYKRAMQSMKAKGTLMSTQVAGDFTLPTNPQEKLFFIAGGIGVTPYRSMLKYLIDTKQQRDIVMIYSNRTAAEIAYRDVLDEAGAKAGAKVNFTLTDAAQAPRGWAGQVGRVDAAMIKRLAPDYRKRTFYLSGSPELVRSQERTLREMGIQRSHIKKDFFPGLA